MTVSPSPGCVICPQATILERNQPIRAKLVDEIGQSRLVLEARRRIYDPGQDVTIARVLQPIGEVEIKVTARFESKLRPAARILRIVVAGLLRRPDKAKN